MCFAKTNQRGAICAKGSLQDSAAEVCFPTENNHDDGKEKLESNVGGVERNLHGWEASAGRRVAVAHIAADKTADDAADGKFGTRGPPDIPEEMMLQEGRGARD